MKKSSWDELLERAEALLAHAPPGRSQNIDLLGSADPRESTSAAIRLLATGDAVDRSVVRGALLRHADRRFQMIVGTMLVASDEGWVTELLSRPGVDHRVIFALIQSAKSRKVELSQELISSHMNHKSIFVRLAVIDYVCSRKISLANMDKAFADLRHDAQGVEFVRDESSPSPIFSSRSKFMRKLSYLKKRFSE